MARLARAEMANMRAMEEENARVNMRGRGHYIGAGATPSMGLSQFRGGKKCGSGYDSSSDEDYCEDCESCDCRCRKGGIVIPRISYPRIPTAGRGPMSTALTRYRPPTIRPPTVRLPIAPRPTSTAIVPYRPPTTRPPVVTEPSSAGLPLVPYRPGQLSPYYRPGVPRPAKPAQTPEFYANLMRPTTRPTTTRPTAARPTAAKPTTAKPPAKGRYVSPAVKAAILRAASLGLPIAALGLLTGLQNAGNGGDGDVYFPEPPGGDEGERPDLPGGGPGDLPGGPGSGPGGAGGEDEYGPDGEGGYGPGGSGDLSSGELDWYLKSGNLPDRYYQATPAVDTYYKVGKGKRSSGDRRSKRAEIVRKVMREHGMSLPQASKYVKQHNLY